MRDQLLHEALRRLATEAATRFSAMVAAGDQIPFDVAADDGEEAAFYSYVPLTSRYVEERAEELRSLPGFGPAREAAVEAGVATAYLEERGEIFIASLWEGCAELSLDRARLDGALSLLDAEARVVDDADVLVVPIVGLRMSVPRLELPHGVRVVRADSIDAPTEAMRSEGMGRAAWEPQFLAVAEQDEGGGAEAAMRQLRELISVMRLFKPGGLGLGPYAFAPTGEGCWRRLATGAPASRPGGYRLSEAESAELVELANALEARPDPDAALAWAVGRFEMGCERDSAVAGLSDHLLALRAVLEGHGPVGASLPMRAAALIAGEEMDRVEARKRLEDMLELERALMSGSRTERAMEFAAWTEESVRGLLLKAALGELGSDLSATADETLIANGLACGDAEITVSVQTSPESSAVEPPVIIEAPPEPKPEEEYMEQETRIMEPVPAEGEIKITATPWLEEVSADQGGDSLEWPAGGEPEVGHRERIDTPRVRHLFPVPDSTWEIRELEYDRRAS